jgi:nuclear pore complex protein Nup160
LVPLQEPFKPVTPPGSTGIWNIADFFLAEVKTASSATGAVVHNTYQQVLRLWISWKSYYASLLQYTDIGRELDWITVMSEETDPSDDEIENSVEFWSDRILRPGRFTDTVLVTALGIYQNRVLPPEQHRDLSSSSRLLRKDLISAIVGCKAKLVVNQHTGQLDFEKYRQDLSLDFSQFETTCKELSKPGEELRRLSFDAITGEVLVVRADGILVIRNLSGAEILQSGATGSDGQFDDVINGEMIRGTLYGDFTEKNVRSQVVALARAAYRFRCAVAGGNLGDITAGLLEEVMSDSNFSVEDRLWAFYDKYISDESFVSRRKVDVISTLEEVTEMSAAFRVLLDILSTDISQGDTIVNLEQLTSIWGDVVTISVADTVSSRWSLLRDFALLSAWLYSTEEYTIDPALKKAIEGYWSDGLQAFKGVNMLRHLAMTEIAPPSSRQSPEEQVSGSLEGMNLDDTVEITRLPPRATALRYVIEGTLDSSGVGLNMVSFSSPMALSLVVASILTQINFGDGYPGMAIRVVSQLERLEATVEAARFSRYLPNSPVGGYVWGRVLLEKGSFEKAATWFSRVAPILTKSGRASDFEDARIILQGKEGDGIGQGLFRYYEHVAKLFERKHAHSHAIYYCQQALGCAQQVRS